MAPTDSSIRVIFLLADYGHDPTETAIPYKVFKDAGFDVSIATETGAVPACDKRMLIGFTQKLLGAESAAIDAYNEMFKSIEWQTPLSWSKEGVSLEDYDLVFLPGGHDKGVRQILDSKRAQELMAAYLPLTQRNTLGRKHHLAAICHGVQLLAHSKNTEGKSILHDVTTTALPSFFESPVYWTTRLFLGDYYKTYGAGTENVEGIVKKALDNPTAQWRSSTSTSKPFVVEDWRYHYKSGRWPGDAELLAKKTVEMVRGIEKSG